MKSNHKVNPWLLRDIVRRYEFDWFDPEHPKDLTEKLYDLARHIEDYGCREGFDHGYEMAYDG